MKAEYDFSDSVQNPYRRLEKQKVTMQIDASTLDYFKQEAARTGIPYQSIINFYLASCAREGKHLTFA